MNLNLQNRSVTYIMIILFITGIALGSFAFWSYSKFKNNIPKTTYEFYNQVGGDKTGFTLTFPGNWIIRNGGGANIMVYSPDQKAQFFLPMNKGQINDLTVNSTEDITIDGKNYSKQIYQSGDKKAILIENFTFGSYTGMGYVSQDRKYDNDLEQIISSPKFF